MSVYQKMIYVWLEDAVVCLENIYSAVRGQTLQFLIDKVKRCFWAIVTVSPQNFPCSFIINLLIGNCVDLRELSALRCGQRFGYYSLRHF